MTRKKLICIGTSTGGPRALQHLLPQFPENFPAPILIVQHMPPVFTKQLSERLNTLANIHVKEAEHHEIVKSGTAYIAPGGLHMTVQQDEKERLKIVLDKSEPLKGHRPSVDRLLFSLKELSNYHIVTLILTGMGSDGTEGLKTLKRLHQGTLHTIAESEESCIVYGMPKQAIQAKVIDEVVKLTKMYKAILKHLQ